ncbi:hypothetical protein BWK69_00855 [Candidatus Parcubacteria bacterium A4]|nr:MAG: hypothetical protein BWK69_00855 [Candidatus Parcubacteria bacterium A4]
MFLNKIIKKVVPELLIDWYHCFFPLLGAIVYRFPSKKLKVIGVTGTNGKSTTVALITAVLEEAGFKVASISSIRFKIKDKEWSSPLKMTMPGRMVIQKFLRQAVNSGCQYAVLEVSSEGIKQHRHFFINFNTAVFTNLEPEHIERHGSFDNYRKAKEKLFQATNGFHIVNVDDKNAEYFLKYPAEKKYGFGLEISNFSNFQKIIAENVLVMGDGSIFLVSGTEIKLKLLGEFNIYNALAAICVGLSQGVDLSVCKSALEKVNGIPGRMQLVIPEPFKFFVDYAVTPEALEKVYQTLQNSPSKADLCPRPIILGVKPLAGKLICLLGACGGGRDKWKRPILGKIASQYCDEIILTNEDPYDENPLEIIKNIESGFSQIPNIYKIIDRREAIRKAISLAKSGDVIISTGKGSELWMCLANGKKIPWNEAEIAREEFEKNKKQKCDK